MISILFYFILLYINIIPLDFWKIVSKFDLEDATFKFLVNHGLNSKANKESLIALYLPEKKKKKVYFY
jgi:hypothetical protein